MCTRTALSACMHWMGGGSGRCVVLLVLTRCCPALPVALPANCACERFMGVDLRPVRCLGPSGSYGFGGPVLLLGGGRVGVEVHPDPDPDTRVCVKAKLPTTPPKCRTARLLFAPSPCSPPGRWRGPPAKGRGRRTARRCCGAVVCPPPRAGARRTPAARCLR